MSNKKLHFETLQLHVGQEQPDPATDARAVPIVAGLAVASGAAAVTYALQNIAGAGDHIVAADNLYGGSFNLITHTLANQGISNTIVKHLPTKVSRTPLSR